VKHYLSALGVSTVGTLSMNKYELAKKINELEGLTNEEKSELLKLLRSQKKYGLVWEDKPEDAELRMVNEQPVLVEVPERAIVSDDAEAPNHILIEGDNLEALTALSYTHSGKIDVIYIDPPYNTGNKDFLYNDKYLDADDAFKHSTWLSFMKRRLILAHNLMASEGLLFISISDEELAPLKLLCDEIFMQKNYINTVSVKAKSSAGASGGGEDKKLKKNIEYLLIYCKNREKCNIIFPLQKQPLIEHIQEKREAGTSWLYTNVMYNQGKLEYVTSTKAGNNEDIKIYRVRDYIIKTIADIMEEEHLSEEQVYNKYIDKIFTTENAQTSIRQRVKNAVGTDNEYYIARYVPVSGRNKGKEIDVGFIGNTKRLVSFLANTCYKENKKVYKLIKIGTLWNDLSWSSVSSEGGVSFPAGKKPVALIKRIVAMHPKSNAIVLDFFAGSASTGHSVMELNEEDGGQRTFICSTSSENNICQEKAYPRLKNVILGYGKKFGLTRNNLRYYKTKFVPRDKSPKNLRRLMELSTDMLCIHNDTYIEKAFAGKRINNKIARYFESNDGCKRMLVIYLDEAIQAIVELIKQEISKEAWNRNDEANSKVDAGKKAKLMVYVFSPNGYAYDDEVEEVADYVSLCAMPDAVLNAYRRVLPKRKQVQLLDDVEEVTESENRTTEELDLFQAQNYAMAASEIHESREEKKYNNPNTEEGGEA